jgi:hypothetical protein
MAGPGLQPNFIEGVGAPGPAKKKKKKKKKNIQGMSSQATCFRIS